MSNRAVSATYRTIIDDVILNVRQDFEDMGIEKEVLDELQRSWEAKIVATGVADFEGAAPVQPRRRQQQTQPSTSTSGQQEAGGKVKQEDAEGELGESNGHKRARLNGDGPSDTAAAQSVALDNGTASAVRDGVNGASSNVDKEGGADEGSDANGNKRKRPISDDDAIGSDLDDSDEDEMEGNVDADGNEDMILCLYDKVQRVRNKWKCVLKDGIASIDGRDYVFSKLSSELEW